MLLVVRLLVVTTCLFCGRANNQDDGWAGTMTCCDKTR